MGNLYGEGTADEKLLRLADTFSALLTSGRLSHDDYDAAITDIANLRGVIEDIRKAVQCR